MLTQERLAGAITNVGHAAQILRETLEYVKQREARNVAGLQARRTRARQPWTGHESQAGVTKEDGRYRSWPPATARSEGCVANGVTSIFMNG